MSHRPGQSRDSGFDIFLGVAASLGVGALLYGAYKATIDEESPHDPDTIQFLYADTEAKCRQAATVIRKHCNNFKYLGMDCLWTNNAYNKREDVGLLQLATTQGFCVIIPLCQLQNNISMELKSILTDTDILKVGIGIDQNVLFIEHDHQIDIRGTLELCLLANETTILQRTLTDLAKVLCGMNVKKPKGTNWNKHGLTSDQKEYAKNCAIATIKIFGKLRDNIVNSHGIYRYNNIEERLADKD